MARRRKSSRRKSRRIAGNQSFAPSVISGTGKRKRRTYHPVKKHKRRSRIGAVDNTVKTIGGVLLGVGIGMVADKFAPESVKGKMLSAAKTLIGAGVAYTGRKNALALGIGLGLAANGATDAAKDFGIIKGIDEFMKGIGAGSDDTMKIEMNGVPENAGKIMGGKTNQMPSVISGQFMGNANQEIPSIVSGEEI